MFMVENQRVKNSNLLSGAKRGMTEKGDYPLCMEILFRPAFFAS
jgi:hypothetical protein